MCFMCISLLNLHKNLGIGYLLRFHTSWPPLLIEFQCSHNVVETCDTILCLVVRTEIMAARDEGAQPRDKTSDC